MIEEHKRMSQLAHGNSSKYKYIRQNKDEPFDQNDDKSNGNEKSYDATGI